MEFDSKKSKTLMEDGEIKVISNVTCISDASFLEFYQLPVYIDEEGNEKEDGTGETHGKELHKVVKKYKAEESVTYIGADSTKVNTGHKTGTIIVTPLLVPAVLINLSIFLSILRQAQQLL